MDQGARVRAGQLAAQARGVHIGRPSLVDDQTIARIVAERGKGSSYRLIAADLDAARVPTPGGGLRWTARAVRDIYLRHRPTKRNRKNPNEREDAA
jgi:hypothetical protein